MRKFWPLLAFAAAAFAMVSTLSYLLSRSRPFRPGAKIVHLGLVVLLVAVTASTAYKETQDLTLTQGQSATVGGYQLTYDGLQVTRDLTRVDAKALFRLGGEGQQSSRITPVWQYYNASGQQWTRVARHVTLTGDLYLTLANFSAEGETIAVRAETHPLVDWLWVGGALMALGGLLALRPRWGRS